MEWNWSNMPNFLLVSQGELIKMPNFSLVFSFEVIYGNWTTLQFPCMSEFGLCCDRFDRGSRLRSMILRY